MTDTNRAEIEKRLEKDFEDRLEAEIDAESRAPGISTESKSMKEYKVHPAAELFDVLEGAEYEALKADIKEHGLKQPIVLWIDPDGCEVLADGRNRYKICRELDIEPKITTLPKGTDPSPTS